MRRVAGGADFRGSLGEPPGIGAVQDDRGAGLGQSFGHGAAQPARRAGDQRGPPGEIEQAVVDMASGSSGGR